MRHRKKIGNRPHATLVYAKYLAKLFEASGQPLASMHVVSCFKLNGRKSQRLFDHRAGIRKDWRGGGGGRATQQM